MQITLPNIEKLIHSKGDNFIKQYYEDSPTLDFEFVQTTPFIISSNEESYFITSKIDDEIPEGCDYALLALRRPYRKYFLANKLKLTRWIKHPSFEELNPQDVVTSWRSKFKFIKEDVPNNIKGLRPPQIGALYSILAHVQNLEDKGIVVMPKEQGRQKQCYQP